MKIESTTEYDKFNFIPWNRAINQEHVVKLRLSMEMFGFDRAYPLKVSRNFEIIEGQHRYLAAKDLGIPILYVVSDEDVGDAIMRHQTLTRTWKKQDYLHYWKERGLPAYLMVDRLQKRFKLSIEKIIACVCSTHLGGGGSRIFSDGKLTLPKSMLGYEELITNILDLVEEVNTALGKKATFTNSIRFWAAAAALFDDPRFDVERFFKKLQLRIATLHHCVTKDQYLEMLKDVYNFKCREKLE